MNDLHFDDLVGAAPEVFADLLGELRAPTKEAASQVLADSQEKDDGGSPKVRLGFALVIDYSDSPPKWHMEGSVSVRHKVKSGTEQCDEHPVLPNIVIEKTRKPKTGGGSLS